MVDYGRNCTLHKTRIKRVCLFVLLVGELKDNLKPMQFHLPTDTRTVTFNVKTNIL